MASQQKPLSHKSVATPTSRKGLSKPAVPTIQKSSSVLHSPPKGSASSSSSLTAVFIETREIREEREAPVKEASLSPPSLSPGGSPSLSEGTLSFKNFRHHPDMENFYRFIYENDLRTEALAILDQELQQRQLKLRVEKGLEKHLKH